MLGIDDDEPIIIEGEYALAMMEELKNVHGLNEEQEKFYQELKKDIRNKIKRNLTFIKIHKNEIKKHAKKCQPIKNN